MCTSKSIDNLFEISGPAVDKACLPRQVQTQDLIYHPVMCTTKLTPEQLLLMAVRSTTYTSARSLAM